LSYLLAVKVIAMADSGLSPKLKRKREGAESQRKKQRKSKGPEEVADVQTEDATLAATPIASTKLKKGIDKIREEGLANGIHEQAATPTSNKKDKKRSKSKNSEDTTQEAAIVTTPKPATDRVLQGSPTTPLANGISESTPSSKNKKKQRRQRQGEKDEEHAGVEEEELKVQPAPSKLDDVHITNTTDTTAVIKQEVDGDGIGKRKPDQKARKQKEKNHAEWFVSPPAGGWFLPQSPIFSSDEKYLIVATPSQLQLFSTETSLLAHSLPGRVSAYAISSVNPYQVYTANETGLVTLWDWAEDRKIGRWDIRSNVRHVAVTRQPDTDLDLVYCHEIGNSHIINVHALRTKGQTAKTELKQILETKSSISGLKVLLDGKLVVATTSNSIFIGKRSKAHKTAVQDFEYKWREFKTSKAVTTFDAYVRLPERPSKDNQPSKDERENLDLAIGDETGVIYVFENILSSFAQAEKPSKVSIKTDVEFESFRPRRLHWHREAVGSVQWSRDGTLDLIFTRLS
jgi:NET1-associated nuclear protein 1 (U3 small nucleolar RNA-associated protein 17)